MKNKRKLALFTGNRAEYGLFYPILKHISQDNRFNYELIVSGAHLKDNFGNTLEEIKKDGFEITELVEIETADDTLTGTTKGISSSLYGVAKALSRIKPDFFIVYADRFESFGALIASTQMGIPTAHIEGGDYTEGGALDDSVRHAMTKLAHIHFTTNEPASERVLKLGEEPWRVYNVGSPSLDVIKNKVYATEEEVFERLLLVEGKPLIIFTQHSITLDWEKAREQILPSLAALRHAVEVLNAQVIITYPNDDAGAQVIIEEIESLADLGHPNIIIRKSLGRYLYHGVLAVSRLYLGNSSSGIKETAALNCPCLNIGDRQKGRLRPGNVIELDYNKEQIISEMRKIIQDDTYYDQIRNADNPYGSGNAGQQIADVLASIPLDDKVLKKKMTY